MRLVVSPVGLLLVGLLLPPAVTFGADTVLYATAASEGRVDRFALDGGGNVAADPTQPSAATKTNPRRLLVVGCFLYVGEDDRVEVFRIGPNGALSRWASTQPEADMRPTDLAVWPPQPSDVDPAANTARMLYVAQTGLQRVVAYPLETNGLGEPAAQNRTECSCKGPEDCNGVAGTCVDNRCTAGTSPRPCAKGETYLFESTSCAVGTPLYQSLAVQTSRVYAAGTTFDDAQIDGFQIDATTGDLIDSRTGTLAETCATSTSNTGACSCTGPGDCNGSPGSCVDGRCVGETRVCGANPDCADHQTCSPEGVCSCDGPDDCDSSDGSCTRGQCTNSSGATRSCDPTKPSDTTAACPTGQRCLLDRRPTAEWCIRRVHGARLTIYEPDATNHFLFVADRLFGRIVGFKNPRARPETVDAGDFPDGGALRDAQDPKNTPCTKGAACKCSNGKKFGPIKLNVDPDNPSVKRTTEDENSVYEVLFSYSPAESSTTGAFLPPTVFATEFQRGRVDAYRLQPADNRFIVKKPKRTDEDVRTSPVGLIAHGNVLYVASGEVDQVRAYRLRTRKDSTVLEFIGETNEQNGSFPNDVAVALPNTCPQ